jgi:hypothetical protein
MQVGFVFGAFAIIAVSHVARSLARLLACLNNFVHVSFFIQVVGDQEG